MVTISGGNGTTKEEAIFISAPNESLGLSAEYDILSEIFGEKDLDWHLVKQLLVNEKEKNYDIMTVKVKETEYDLWFDITSFYGKY